MYEELIEDIGSSYDTKHGIQSYLNDGLRGLNALIKARSRAGYTYGKRMKEWIILGRWFADTCGNFGKIIETDYKRKQAPKDLHADMPDAVSREELWDILGDKVKQRGFSSGVESGVPPAYIICPECKCGWTIKDCHDTVLKNKWANLPLVEFVGKRLDEVQAVFDFKTNADYNFCLEGPIRNDKWIDLTTHPKYDTMKVNEFGSIRDSSEARAYKDRVKGQHLYADYTIKEGDTGCFDVWRYYHKNCHERMEHKKAEEYFCELIDKAGWTGAVWMIPNEYCDCERCWPWVKFGAKGGMIKVGWRKRVINIDWSDTENDYSHLFEDEGVTVCDKYVHAYGKDKAIEYLTKIRECENE